MDKDQVAAILDEIGTLLELQGENSFRCNAYHAAARSLGQVTTNLADLVRAGFVIEIPAGDTGSEEPPVAIPLPAAVVTAPLGMLMAGVVARQTARKRAR